MAYSMITMRQALINIGTSSGINPFKESTLGVVHPALANQFKFRPKQNFVNDLLEYCWLVYSKAITASGPQFIGRFTELWDSKQLREKVGITDPQKQFLWDKDSKGIDTRGNALAVDRWAPTVNDCWVLGGVHRRADFELVSIRTLKNLWDFGHDFPIVTAREILGLVHFGYKFEQQPSRLRLVCKNAAEAKGATIEQYDTFMYQMQAKGPDSIRSILVMDPALQKDIQNFDKSRLRHVTSPR